MALNRARRCRAFDGASAVISTSRVLKGCKTIEAMSQIITNAGAVARTEDLDTIYFFLFFAKVPAAPTLCSEMNTSTITFFPILA